MSSDARWIEIQSAVESVDQAGVVAAKLPGT